jgi:uncharacterized protein (UPF0548 family)
VTQRAVDSADRGLYLDEMNVASKPSWMFREPSPAAILAFLEPLRASEDSLPFSYLEVGASRHNAERPRGYNLDHNRVQIGTGTADFEAACAALRGWRMFPSPWTRISPAEAPIRVGEIVAMQAHALGVWWMNAARIVYTIDEPGPTPRYGFAYGTLQAHVEEGEERFSVELHEDGSVWYDLRAFSRPHYWPVRIGARFARRLQARFVRESQASMRVAVKARSPGRARVKA